MPVVMRSSTINPPDAAPYSEEYVQMLVSRFRLMGDKDALLALQINAQLFPTKEQPQQESKFRKLKPKRPMKLSKLMRGYGLE